MKKRLIHGKRLNKLTQVYFSYNDVSIDQDGHLIVLDKDEILELATIIINERRDLQFYESRRKLHEKRGI